MINTLKLLSRLRAQNIELWLEGDKLRCKAPAEALTPEIRKLLADEKERLIQFLTSARKPSAIEPVPVAVAPLAAATEDPHALPMTPAQRRIWILEQLRPDNPVAVHQRCFKIEGPLDQAALQVAFNALLTRHRSLRLSFDAQNLTASVAPNTLTVPFVQHDLARGDFTLQDLLERESRQPFELDQPPLMRVTLVRESDTCHYLNLVVHRLVADETSIGLIIDQLNTHYACLIRGEEPNWPKATSDFADYARALKNWCDSTAFNETLRWWKDALAGAQEALDLPCDRPRPTQLSFLGARIPVDLDDTLNQRLDTLRRERGFKPATLLLAAFKLLLYRVCHQRDILVGCRPAERTTATWPNIIGPLANWHVLRTQFVRETDSLDFEGFATLIESRLEKIQAYADLPYEVLFDELQTERDLSRNTLFQTTFAYEESIHTNLSLEGCSTTALEPCQVISEYDLSLTFLEGQGRLNGFLTYNTNLFTPESIQRLKLHFLNLLNAGLAMTQQRIIDLELLDLEQRNAILVASNNTEHDFMAPLNLKSLFEASAIRYPNETALRFGGLDTTYEDLDRTSNQLARQLRSQGVMAETPVAVFMGRCRERIIVLLAILKAGGLYLPLDPDYPHEGLAFFLEDGGARMIITQPGLADDLKAGGRAIIEVDPTLSLATHQPHTALDLDPEPDQLAYIIYTSGPHAKNKGVQTSHRAVANRLLWLQQTFKLEVGDRLLQKTPFLFDIAVWENFWPLISGATLVLARPGTQKDTRQLIAQVAEERITHLHFVPSVLKEFLKSDEVKVCIHLKKTFCSGEALPTELQRKFFSRFPKAELHNLYGPPEVTIDATCWDYKGGPTRHSFPIGRPIFNVKVFVVDGHFCPMPIGVEGELLIGGVGLSRGYRNRPVQTALRFIPDPFSDKPGARLFKTGDLVRYLPDMNLEFAGHLEHHRKMRGFRIDYEEIQSVLEGHPLVARALAISRKDNLGENQLVAYIIPAGSSPPQEDDLRVSMRKILPNYMIPTTFVMLQSFPKSGDGKIDRRALPIPIRETGEEEPYARAHSEIERVILNTWRKVLGLNQIEINQNFFEIGGDSLALIRVYRELPEILTQDLQILDLYRHPTIHDLAHYFEGREEDLAISSTGADHRDQVQRFMEQVKQETQVSIAIIGMAGRFPGARTINEFWKNIQTGTASLSIFTAEELTEAGVSSELVADPSYVPIRGIIDHVRDFDADFFDFTPREAQITDPQHRIFLECAWEALETAGYVPRKYRRPIGIYGGVGYNQYFAAHIAPNNQILESVGSLPIMIGNGADNFCTRIAYKLGLTGPALTVQTACSTGLVAVHLACQGLKNRDCEVALAGGVHLGDLDKSGYLYEEGMTLPPDGVCRSFDHRAMGATVSQGATIVVLKRLEDALRDGDRVYAVIKGTAVNNDGARKDGYTTYSGEGQVQVVTQALEQAGINPDSVTYVESSSTASPIGDPIEVESLTKAFRARTDRRGYCTLGALKPNIGGLDVAAGCAALIKAALALHHRKLPPLINFEKPNPQIDFENSPFVINTRCRDWVTQGVPRRAGVSAFGLGGTNAHVVLEEGPRFEPSPHSRSYQLITLSAKSASALETMTTDLLDYMREHPHDNFADICYTLHVGRNDYKYRKVLVAPNLATAILELENKDSEKVFKAIHKADNRPIAFMFPGQGAQYLNMGRQLYREERIYRREVDRCWAIVHKHFPEVYRGLSAKDLVGRTPKVDRTVVTQPLLFATEYALAKQLMHWGIHPQAMIGNSLGEYVAACLAGVFSLEDCIVAIVTRGRLMQEVAPGAQLAVKLPEAHVRPLLNPQLSLAGIPNPNMCMVSGDREAILKLKHELEAQRITCYRLHAPRAFHSYMMDPVVTRFTETLAKLELKPPSIPFISNVTGTWITDEQATSPHYWARHLREPVRFSQGLEVLLAEPNRILLEVGPEKILRAAAISHPAKTDDHRVLATMRQPQEEESDMHHLLNTVGRLWLAGVEIDWDNYHGDKQRFRVPLPTYPFERTRHWIDKPKRDYFAVLEPDVLQTDIEPKEDHYRPNVSTEFVPPRDDDERFIAQIWCDFLGLKEVGVHDDFFELGGSSLIAVRLVGLLGKQFNVPIASHVLLKKRTIATLAGYIKQHVGGEESDASLVEIQRGHPRSLPLFLVHPVGGEVFFYRDMAQALGPDQALYAFQALSLVGKMEPFSDIPAQAAFYIKELLKFRPRSPFLLGGSSYGGCVAYEMAQQLTEKGYQVPLVVLVDSPGPGAIPDKLIDFAEILDYLLGDELNINLEELRDRDLNDQLAYVFEEARFANRMDLLPASLGIPMFKTWMAHQEAMHSYKPQPYNGKVVFFRPTTEAKRNLMHMHLPWIDLVQGGIEIHQIPGNHLTMNEKPNVDVLARHLKRILRGLTR